MDSILSSQTAIQTAKLASFPIAFFLSGYTWSSQNAITSLLDHRPQATAPATSDLLRRSAPIVHPLTMLSTCSSAYLAYALPEQRRAWTTSAIAMGLTVAWGMWTVVAPVKRLEAISKDEQKVRKSEQNLEHRQIMAKWVSRNNISLLLQVVSAVTGLLAVVRV